MKKESSSKSLYSYQHSDIDKIFERLSSKDKGYRLLYQLPTGGGKTVVFAEIVRRYIEKNHSKALVLTHRIELCRQTSATLKGFGVHNKMVSSSVKRVPKLNEYKCFVAMVETLKNRLQDNAFPVEEIGLVIIDEAHHNSFGKLLESFPGAFVIGVTATPLSSDPELPMKQTYGELITGQSIRDLIEQGYLAKPVTFGHEVELTSLKVGDSGDFTTTSSDELYSTEAMLELLFNAYESRSKGKKTLIFNNGIRTSEKVREFFEQKGYTIKHLDNTASAGERAEILRWFKKTRDGILTSVSILTTGFDEPTVQTVILNRATKSLTLYYQMIGRGSRRLPRKKSFTIIDLGNNFQRFGLWNNDVNWQEVFDKPQVFLDSTTHSSSSENVCVMPPALRSLFPKSVEVNFDIDRAIKEAHSKELKPKVVIRDSIRQHAFLCIENSESVAEARKLASQLGPDIENRVKVYTLNLDKTSKSYREWLTEDYKSRLNILIGKIFNRIEVPEVEKELKKL